MRAYCKCCKEHYDTDECPDNHDPEGGVCWECIFTGKILETDEEEEVNNEDVALIQWGDPANECPKVEKIRFLLEATLCNGDSKKQLVRDPSIAELKIESPSAKVLLRTLHQFITDHTELHVVYISCHANDAGLSYKRDGASTIPYPEICQVLSEALSNCSCVHVIFGACEVMTATPPIENQMPRAVDAVSGFTGCSTAAQVAGLIANVFVDNVAFLDKRSAVSRALRGKGIADETVSGVIDAWKTIMENLKKSSTQEVCGAGGVAVVQSIRDAVGGNWDRKTIPLTSQPTPAKLHAAGKESSS